MCEEVVWTSGVVSKLCVSKLCVGGGRAGRCGQAEVHNQKQEPHAKMCGKIVLWKDNGSRMRTGKK